MKFIIESRKSKDEIIQILQENTSEHKNDLSNDSYEYFNGNIFEDSFQIQRNINYRNSFLPVIIGNIEEVERGCKIKIKMRMNLFVKGFMIFWFLFVILFCFITPFVKFEVPFCFIPYIMLVFGIVLVRFSTKSEIEKARKKLEELLK